MRFDFLLISGLLLTGACAQTVVHPAPPVYTPPAPLPPIGLELSTGRNFDQTWEALVDHASAASFAIDEFERDSGLLILSYSPGDPGAVADCGTWQQSGQTVPYIGRNLGFRLRTRANILVRRAPSGGSRVRINMLYELRDDSGSVYEFTTNEPAVVAVRNASAGTQRTRTCQSNHVAEQKFLGGVRDALQ